MFLRANHNTRVDGIRAKRSSIEASWSAMLGNRTAVRAIWSVI